MSPIDLKYLIDTSPTPFTFVTGGAGTGKSHLLRGLDELLDGNCLICAPTGLAAYANQSQTIHSLFRLPTSIACYDAIEEADSKAKIQASEQGEFIAQCPYLIIDEISMVRRDIISALDDVLCSVCDSWQPFGGKKVIMFGDLNQLPPVANATDANFIKKVYGSPYFFMHYPFTRYRMNIIRLTTNHRQAKDPEFAQLLNHIAFRDVRALEYALSRINNKCYSREPFEKTPFLCPDNKTVDAINTSKMAQLKGKEYTFKAEYSDGYNKRDAPVMDTITLKIGALVMLRVNDKGGKYVNGTKGEVKGFRTNTDGEIDGIYIEIKRENSPDETIVISKHLFTTKKYILKKTGKGDDKGLGISEQCEWMKQYPLSIAYAITIHKSQGMSLDSANLLGKYYFAHGQLYTALSRLRTLNGLRLLNRLSPEMCIRDEFIDEIYKFQYEPTGTPITDFMSKFQTAN